MAPRTSTSIAQRGRPAGGFTLIELMVTIAIAAILTVIAAPSFTQYQRNSELNRSSSAFMATLSAARAEAMKRQLNAMVRPCANCNDNWAMGWQAYVDGDWDFVPNGASDVAILNQDPLPTGVTISTNTADVDGLSHYILFNGAGYAQNKGFSPYYTTVAFTNSAGSRLVKISPSGRMRVCNPVTDTTCTLADTF